MTIAKMALTALAALGINGTAAAQADCPACDSSNFIYLLILIIFIFAVYFYLRNREPVMKKPDEPEKTDEPGQRDG